MMIGDHGLDLSHCLLSLRVPGLIRGQLPFSPETLLLCALVSSNGKIVFGDNDDNDPIASAGHGERTSKWARNASCELVVKCIVSRGLSFGRFDLVSVMARNCLPHWLQKQQ